MSPRFLFVGLLLLAACGCGARTAPGTDPVEPPPVEEKEDTSTDKVPSPRPQGNEVGLAARWIRELVAGGWERPAAERVVRLNESWWRQLAEADPELPELQIALLQKMPRANELTAFLQAHPETAGLLLSAPDPVALAALLDGRDYPVLAGLFVRHAAAGDMADLADALSRHQHLIVRLQRRGLLGSEVLFLRGGKARPPRAYEEWLTTELEKRLAGTDEAMASFFHFALDSGPALRDRLAEDERFRRAFPDRWRKLSRVVAGEGGALEHFLDEPGLWDTLGLDDAEQLLAQWGPVAVQLLFGSHAYPEKLRPQVVEALLQGDETAVRALLKFRNERLFLELLGRDLPAATRIACMQHLLKKDSSAPGELRRLMGMSRDGVARHVGPPADGPKTWLPLYSTYVVFEKWQDGRDISAMEWVLAVGDPASTFLPAGKVMSTGMGQGLNRVTARQAAEMLKKQAAAFARRALIRQAAVHVEKATARQTVLWGTSQVLGEMQRDMRVLCITIDRLASLDITRPVQFAFKRSGLHRETFERLTGLEARLIMRPDARVRVHLLRKDNIGKLGKAAERIQQFLEPSATEEVAQRSGQAGRRSAKSMTSRAALVPKVDEEQWRRNVSAWWLLHASGLWKQMTPQRGLP